MTIIVADTTCGLPHELLEKGGIPLIPQVAMFGEESYHDNKDFDTAVLMQKLKASPKLPKTAAPEPSLYFQAFDEARQKRESVVVIAPTGYYHPCAAKSHGRGLFYLNIRPNEPLISNGIMGRLTAISAQKCFTLKENDMSGHSKWSTIKRKKGAADAKRGAIFTRLTRELVMAAREGGSDPDSNFRLRLAVDKARAENMPKDNIERAIKRGAGEDKDAAAFEQITYEGYAPHGVAVMVETVTDNRNRTISDLRHAFTKAGGNMAEPGAVGWQFERVAYFSFPSSAMNYDKAFELGIDLGANDVVEEDGSIEITAPVEAFKVIADALHKAKVQPEEANLRMIPKQEMELSAEDTVQVLRALETIEDLDDVLNVYSNLKVSDEALAALETA